jgi:hypothetical protein
MLSLINMLFYVFDIVFDFWFVLILAPLQNRKSGLRNMIYVWVLWAVIRVILFFAPEPLPSLMIPEPLSTILFFVTGFVLIAVWFIWNYFKSDQLRKKALGMSAKDLLDLPPGEFEEMTTELYRARGFQARKTGASGDHGVDVVVKSKDGKTMVVQCKRWRKPVGEPIIREFYGTMHHEKAAHGTIIATSGFTPQAIEWAKGKPMSLYDGNKFIEMWQKSKKQKSPAQQSRV